MNLSKPDVLMRPAPLWSWNDKLEPDELRRQIREMAKQGWGGFFMHPRVGYTTHYLSERWMECVKTSIDEAQKHGIKAWIYDEDRWPSGYGAGLVTEQDPAYRSRALVIRAKGTQHDHDTVVQEVEVNGQPYVICEQLSKMGQEWFNGGTFTDLMNPDAVKAFLNGVHEVYRKAVGEHFGKTIPGVFTDEPLYLANNLFDALAVPWSTKLPAFFQQVKGYDIRQHLPKLFLDREDFRRVRFDFYDVASRLFRESWTKQYYQWCDQHNLKLTGHFQAEESLRLQIQWTGDVMAHYQWMHWPGVDKLHRDVDDVIQTKQVASVVDQLGKERYLCEAWGVSGPHVAIFHRKWVGDWLMALGVNFINPHLSHYSLRGPRKRDCPPSLLHQAPWWDDEHVLSDYQARVCALMSQGRRRVDVLMLQPLSSVWCDYSPMQWDSGYAPVTAYDKPYDDLAKRLLAAQIDFHIGNETIMADHGKVDGDRLIVGKQDYKIVVLPPTLNLRRSTLELLRQLLATGGTVIVTGPTPTHVDGVPAAVELKGALHATRVVNALPLVVDRMPPRVVAIDRLTGKPAKDVIIHSRDVADKAHHFIANTAELRAVQLTVQFPKREAVSVVDTRDGTVYAAPLNEKGELEVTLAPAGSLLLVTGHPIATDAPALLGSGATFNSSREATPPGVPGGVAFRPLDEPFGYSDTFNVTLQEPNVLRVDEVDLTVGDKHFIGPIAGAWEHYYGLPDGTSFRAVMRFRSVAAIEGCDAVIDSAEHLESVRFNGEAVIPARRAGEPHLLDPNKVWKDIALTRVPLPPLRIGVNELVLTGKKVNVAKPGGLAHRRTTPNYEPQETQLEEIFIAGRFSLQEAAAGQYQIAPERRITGGDLTTAGAPFYAGRATFTCELTLPDKPPAGVCLSLQGLEAASARVTVNGNACGTLAWKPHVLDVSKVVRPGVNRIEIDLSTTLCNAMGPQRTAGNMRKNSVYPSHYFDMARITGEYDLIPFGLRAVTLAALTPPA